jgi:predicted transcriptional regulator
MPDQNGNLLTDAELGLMLILWQIGEGTVHEVLAAVTKQRPMAYTTASTIIRILEKKGFVHSRKDGKAHIYTPSLTKQAYESRTLGHVVQRLFENTPVSLVARLIDDHRLTPDEIRELKKLLDAKE